MEAQCFHGDFYGGFHNASFSMGFPFPWTSMECFHGDCHCAPMGLPLKHSASMGTSNGLPLPWDFQADFPWRSIVLPWDFHGTFMEARCFHWGFHERFHGTFMEAQCSHGDFHCAATMPPVSTGLSWCFHGIVMVNGLTPWYDNRHGSLVAEDKKRKHHAGSQGVPVYSKVASAVLQPPALLTAGDIGCTRRVHPPPMFKRNIATKPQMHASHWLHAVRQRKWFSLP